MLCVVKKRAIPDAHGNLHNLLDSVDEGLRMLDDEKRAKETDEAFGNPTFLALPEQCQAPFDEGDLVHEAVPLLLVWVTRTRSA